MSARSAIESRSSDPLPAIPPLAPSGASSAAEYTRVLGRLAGVGARICLLRDRPEDVRGGGDLDLLLDPADRAVAGAALVEEGFILRRGVRSPLKEVFVRYDRGVFLMLDVHWAMVQGGLRYADESLALARRCGPEDAPRLSQEDELIHLVAHLLLRGRPPEPRRLERATALLSEALDQSYLVAHTSRFGWGDVFAAACAWLRAGAPPTARSRLRSRFTWALIRRDRGNAVRLIARIVRRLASPSRPGGLIALVGPDGAGKSTVIAAALARGSAIPGLRLESVYLGPWGRIETGALRMIRKMGITPSLEPWGERVTRLDGASLRAIAKWVRSEIKGLIFYFAVLGELWWRYLRSVAPRTRQGTWVLADRYITDLRYLYKGDLIPNYRILRAAVCSLYPEPSMFILVDQAPETIHRRKAGLSVEQIRAFQDAYRRTLQGRHWVLVTTDETPEAAADRVLEVVVRLWAGDRPGHPRGNRT